MSDKRIDQLTEKPSLTDADLIVVSESSGTTWKATVLRFREYLFGLVSAIVGPPDRNDTVFLRQFSGGGIRRVPIEKLLPSGVVTNDMIADGSDVSGTGITSAKLAPSSITHPKLAIDAVHTHNIANAEIANIDNYPPRLFGTGVTTEKICDGAVTGIKGGVPPGSVFHFAARTAPEGYLICNGNTISSNLSESTQGVPNWRLQDLRSVLGATFGVQGRLPDLRGVFVRSYGGGEGSSGTVHNGLDTGTGATGRSSRAVYKHFIFVGSGPKSSGQIADEARNTDPTPSLTDYYAVEFTDNSGTKFNPGDGQYAPRNDNPVTVVAFAKTLTDIGVNLSQHGRYKIYAMRRLQSGPFGQHQESRYLSHNHAISEASHTHANTASFNTSAIRHRHTVNLNYTGAKRDGMNVYRPWDHKNLGKNNAGTSDWPEGGGSNVAVALVNQANSTNLTCESSFSHGYSPVPIPASPTFSRPVNVSTLSDPVDETRPSNVALLPCIKY